MRCEVAERELSARLDGEGDRRPGAALEEHLASCARCRAFAAGTERLRILARFEAVEPVPDLVPRIMAEVRREAGRGTVRTLAPRVPRWSRYAVAFAAGLVAAAVLVGGLPGIRPGPAPALATEIPGRIAAASTEVTAYQAEFRVVERGYHRRVPERSFTTRVSFRAPERFRAAITDATAYPSVRWPRNDVVLAVDADRWLLDGPATCPREALPACATGGRETRRVTGREPFDGDALLPTDIVLPVRTLVGTDRVRVIGQRRVLGRDAVTVELAYRDAVPLFAYLHAGGSWRPFFPQDRVLVSLDAESWFPLRYEVLPAPGLERTRWADRNGLPSESADRAVFEATATSFRTGLPAGWEPLGPFPGPVLDEGFRDEALEGFPGPGGPVVPSDLAGLEPYRVGSFVGGGRPEDEVLLSFTRGLAWLNVLQTRSWTEPELFGDVGDLAARVELPGGGVGYYEPATATLGRRLSIHARDMDLYLETNLPRANLLRVAASLPVEGRPVPERWLVRRWPGGIVRAQVTLDEARSTLPQLLLPARLPDGYRLWTVHVVTAKGRSGVAVFFRRPGSELDGVGIRLFQAAGQALAPPMDPDVLAVRVRGVTGRYSPTRGELEWVEDGVYRSLGGTALDLGGLLAVARSLEERR
ncbi:MAG: zf-HC2 domain-containing protein [Actinomycetota bacterium]